MALRNVDIALKNALVANVPLQVYHLIKFEKPSNIDYVKNNLKVPDTSFTYLTDAPYPVEFDGQTYNCTNFAKVGTVSEDIVAKATGMTLTINANSIGRSAIGTITIGQLATGGQGTLNTDIDLFQSGFLPGDEITISSGSTFNFKVKIDSIKEFNSTTQKYDLVVTALEQISAVTNQIADIEYSASATTALTTNAQSVLNFQNYINKTVDIYRCFANPKTGDLYGTPVLLFRGIIAKGKLTEKGSGISTMAWTLTSHWGDFVRVQGRLTSDEFHRALDPTGTPNEDSLLREEYKEDKGFEHAARSLNVLAPYINTRTRSKLRKKSSWGGIRKSYYMEEETYTVAEELDVNINLAAQFIPVVYGVNKVEANPVFADIELGEASVVENGTQTARNTTLYTANVISEGPIRAIYDIIIDDEGLVCRDSADADAREFGTTTDTYTGPSCVGNMVNGDVLSGDFQYKTVTISANGVTYELETEGEPTIPVLRRALIAQGLTAYEADIVLSQMEKEINESADEASYRSVNQIGINHEKRFTYEFGGDTDVVDITFHAGLKDQYVDYTLYDLSVDKKFKIQNDYYEGTKKDYWSTNHRLLDTAYAVQVDAISASSGQQPKFDYIVKGKYVKCYNYDGTYRSIIGDPETRQANYKLGEIVNVWVGSTSSSGTTAQIIDKFYLYDPYQQIDWRFKLGPNPNGNSNMDVLTPIINGSAGKVVMQEVGGGVSTQWTMVNETYTGDNANPVQTPTTTSSGGSNYFEVNGLVFDGINFSYDDADFIYEKTSTTIDRDTDDDLAQTGNQGAGSGGSSTTTTTNIRYHYVLVLDQLNANPFAKEAVEVLAIMNKDIYFKLNVGLNDTAFKIRAVEVAAALNSDSQGKITLKKNSLSPVTQYTDFMVALDKLIDEGGISTIKTTSSTSELFNTSSNTTVTSIKYTTLPEITARNYNLIYQDPQDSNIPSDMNNLNITFKNDQGGEFTPSSTINIPDTEATFFNTNNILGLETLIISPLKSQSALSSILNGLTYSYGSDTNTQVDNENIEGSTEELATVNSIFNVQDARVSNNPALILLDYLTNKRYGKGIRGEFIDIDSFKEAANVCDTGSDVTVTILDQGLNAGTIQVGDICRYPASGDLVFQGTVSSVSTNVTKHFRNNQIGNVHSITFTDCIGKLGKKWAKNRSFKANEIVWYNGYYRVVNASQDLLPVYDSNNNNTNTNITILDSGEITIAAHSSNSSIPFFADENVGQSLSNAPSIIFSNLRSGGTFYVNAQREYLWNSDPDATPTSASDFESQVFASWNGNPIVKRIEEYTTNGDNKYRLVSGYSLYDSDDVKYWKYLGWESWDQRWATRHQLNTVIDTSQKLFDNVNTLLSQFNGMLRYSNGKYFLDLKVQAKELNLFDSDTEIITEEDIIGNIDIEDKGISNTFNALSCQMSDPALTFGTRTLSFFNSNYLSQDKGIQRQGTYVAPGITNYFNLRINAQQALDESRAGLTISFTLPPKGYLLLAGNIIAITYKNFNWENKLFRIENTQVRSDLLVNIVAKEHNDNAYRLNYMANDLVSLFSDVAKNSNTIISRPINLSATDIVEDNGAVGGIGLTWENTGDYSESTHIVEVWMNPNNQNFSGASQVHTTSGTTITDPILNESGTVERWYWIRYKIMPGLNSSSNSLKPLFSSFYPSNTQPGIKGIGTASIPERVHGIPKGATSSTRGRISSDPSEEVFSLSSSWVQDPEFGGTVPAGAHAVQRLTEPLGAKRYQFVWDAERLGGYKWRGPNNSHTLSDIVLNYEGEKYEIGSLQSSYSTTTTKSGGGTRYWDFYAMKTTRTDGLAAGVERFIFDSYPPLLASKGAPNNSAEVPEADAIVDMRNVADNDTRELYIIFDHSVPECFLAQWDSVTNSGNGPSYWRDVGNGNATLNTAWTAISGTSFTNEQGYNITGVGTTFTTDLQAGDVIALTTVEITSSSTTVPQHSARVAEVISDTEIRLDRENTSTAYTINYLYRTSYRPDTTNDAVIAKIDRGS